MSHGLKLLLIAAGAIITCIVVVVGFQLTKSGKNDTNKAAEEYSAMIGDYDDIQMTIYEDMEVSGADVVTYIKDNAAAIVNERIVSINVLTKSNQSQNYLASEYKTKTVADVKNKVNEYQQKESAGNYINPTGSFACLVLRNENGMIMSVSFVQK